MPRELPINTTFHVPLGSGLVSCINGRLLTGIHIRQKKWYIESVNDSAQDLQEYFAIPVVVEDVFSSIAPEDHMVNCDVKFHYEGTSHN